ncbi:hypothetical protein [Mycolicibacterium palauense]|uniref:hypothetical protein n=1 Tax=Mycolicibacterium palauense TaxID=2034511 RepID=UPI000BFEB89B|nr:hypothetical protein [Mycolicibacterium palauense]
MPRPTVVLATSGLLAGWLTACSPAVVNTEGVSDYIPEPSTTALPAPDGPPGNDRLLDASEFYATSDGLTAYFFTTPSMSWRCAIVPHTLAGCQAAGGRANLGVPGQPDTVTDTDGEQKAPNAIVVAATGEPRFTVLDGEEFRLVPGPPRPVDFGQVLAAAGFRCNVGDAGISCASETTGKGFTFDADGYRFAYTEAPPP